ncbi:MAG: hypothetical protein HY782_17135 [Chloroflexi bacterium]|nr:hypothetical protein [Chloroflexota bacterium]
MTEKEMEKKIKSLERRIEKLERSSRQKNGRVERKKRTRQRESQMTAPAIAPAKLSERERTIEILQSAGMLAELTPEDKALAAEWRALPEERKREVTEKLESLRLDPPLSQIIQEQRR